MKMCIEWLSLKVNDPLYRDEVYCLLSKGFTEGKPYAMETANGKHFATTQYLRAAHGKSEKEWPFISCSNIAFTEVCIPVARVEPSRC